MPVNVNTLIRRPVFSPIFLNDQFANFKNNNN
jgi:hypothetical protein